MVRTKRKITYPLSNIVKFDVFVQSILVQTSHFGFNMHSIAYLVTWKRGALMPTRTTIFFCSTSRSTRGRWQPVRGFFPAQPNPTLKNVLPCFTGFSSEDFELEQRSKVRVDELCLGTNDLFVVIFWIPCFHFKLEGASFSFFLFSPVFNANADFHFCRALVSSISVLFDLNNWHT